jgi:transcriptional regulator with XRE-family HTH domain
MKIERPFQKVLAPKFDQELSDFLRLQFEMRKSRNPKFSMRSFAKMLGMDQSLLSKVLQGKRKLSPVTIRKCLQILKVPDFEIKRYINYKKKPLDYHKLNEDMLEVISEWYHFAILELMTVRNFVLKPESASEALGISLKEAELAIRRLQKLGFIRIYRGKYLLKTPNNSWFSSDKTSEARKSLQKQLLHKSLRALEVVPFEFREHTSMTVAVNREYIPEIKRIITEASQELASLMQRSTPFHEVYQLTINFFPVKVTEHS